MPAPTLGNEIHDVDFGELVRSVAQGIADGQRALDLTAINTLRILSATPVSVIPEVTEVITSEPFQVNVSGQSPVWVTGARVTETVSNPVTMSALQAGMLPTFYQFTEATIQLKLSVSLRKTQDTSADGTVRAFGANVNFRTQNTFSYSADSATSVNVTMRPVPPARQLQPSIITVNALGPKPVVTVNS